MNKPKIALTIAGTDPTGGAGVMADLKSFHSCGVYGMAANTSIVAQNTLGVQSIHNLETSWGYKSNLIVFLMMNYHML